MSTHKPGTGAAGDPHRPLEITQVGLESLEVSWADGHRSSYPLAHLRRLCLCASCRTARAEQAERDATRQNPFRVLGPAPSSQPAALEQVGNYALGVTWRDQHYSIFAFESLRGLCPCRDCAATRAAGPSGEAGV